ncbi:c-type cytochrome [Paracoccus seriniphilus]|uniref:Cytochrome c n=1 Tax=Paracoccus seriniphilus TaxID=184748 RepID=A0A239Q1U2_9RHOB|nr:cytochrome c family protein [Paracoccus seriniphilus]WCR13271.1 cytochrome c family protein [Paracoccus seriniphilus]SNT76474.1 cytochrome c [Paracoccus seriniphilus]
MFNTMTVTKAAGALIGALLFLLLANWAASGLYSVGAAHHGGEGEEHAQAYTIPVEESSGGAEKEEVQIDFAALMAEADPAKGEKAFGKCKACHKLDGNDGVGPHLNGVVGRNVASVDGFSYSDAMHAHADEAPQWTPEALQEFLTNPKGVVKGTKMSFAGLKKPEDRANLIAFLETQQ